MDLSDYKIPKPSSRKNLTKIQRLALEIIAYCQIDKTMAKRWFKIVKRHTAYVEQRFLDFKKTGKKSAAYLFRMIYPK